MSVKRYIPLTVLLSVGLLAVTSLKFPLEPVTGQEVRFQADDFAVLRSRYESLPSKPGGTRAELIRKMEALCLEAQLEPSLIESLQEFSNAILQSKDESAEVKAVTRGLVRTLRVKALGDRVPASS